jgi:hypothetical protein
MDDANRCIEATKSMLETFKTGKYFFDQLQ